MTGLGGSREACSGRAGDRPLCTFAAHWDVKAFNAVGLPYREHFFRRSAKVPGAVKAVAVAVELPGNLRRVAAADIEQYFGGALADAPVLVAANLNVLSVELQVRARMSICIRVWSHTHFRIRGAARVDWRRRLAAS